MKAPSENYGIKVSPMEKINFFHRLPLLCLLFFVMTVIFSGVQTAFVMPLCRLPGGAASEMENCEPKNSPQLKFDGFAIRLIRAKSEDDENNFYSGQSRCDAPSPSTLIKTVTFCQAKYFFAPVNLFDRPAALSSPVRAGPAFA